MSLEDVCGAIAPANVEFREAARRRQERLTKPPGSLGRLEELSLQLAGVFETERPTVRGKAIIVAAGDHGVVAEGVSGYPQAVTAQMVSNFLAGGAAISVIARRAGVELVIADAGAATRLRSHSDLRVVAIGRGTGNIARGPAMLAGVELARDAAAAGADLIGTGDMGIGNTTSAAAITAAVVGKPASEATGRGTGRDYVQLAHKVRVVQGVLDVNCPNPADGLDVLAKVGGFEIGVLAGIMLGAARARKIVVLDGFISAAAALIARLVCPTVGDYLVASHLSAETGHGIGLSHLGLRPLLDLGMRLGEGTGAVLAMGLIEAAAATLSEMATFEEAGVSETSSGESIDPVS